MIAPNIHLFAGSRDLLPRRTPHDGDDDPGEQHDTQHQQEENADPEPLAVHALDTEVEPCTRPGQRQSPSSKHYPLICGLFLS